MADVPEQTAGSERLPEWRTAIGVVIGGFGSFVVAGALVPFRGDLTSANVVLAMVIVVVLAAAVGGRSIGILGAFVSATSYDFFFTHPYGSLKIDRLADIETTVLLLVSALIVGEVTVRALRSNSSAAMARGNVRRIRRIAEQIAAGIEIREVVLCVRVELIGLLGLQGCEFETPPFRSLVPRLDRSGTIESAKRRLVDGQFALPPEGVELPVRGRGRTLGRLLLHPDPNVGVSIEQRLVAVALADQLATALVGTLPDGAGNAG